jgi:hypothetical protein
MKVQFTRLAFCLSVVLATSGLRAEEPALLPRKQFDKMHRFLKRQPNESRWMEIDWYPSVWEARQKAAAEGKPLFIWAGSGGAPAAGC